MFDIGIWELLLVLLVVLFVVGPERIPKVAFTVGKWVQYAKNSFSAVSSEIKQQIDDEYAGQYQKDQTEKHLLTKEKNEA